MVWEIKETEEGWEWFCMQSSYGAITGVANTKNQAKVELAIAEAELFEHPYPPFVVKFMRENLDEVAKDFSDEKNNGV